MTDWEIECVPNVSEGRQSHVIDRLSQTIRSVHDVELLDIHSDPDHNRSVFTFVGRSGAVWEAAFELSREAIKHIDVRQHEGVHPFIGAIDVVPFVPLGDFPMSTTAELAEKLGEHIADELKIPVYLYGEAAKIPERRNLANVRRKGFEELVQEEAISKHPPDLGPLKIHLTAGATAVGARSFLIAYNVNLNTGDLAIARKIARQIRERDGGLPGVKALGVLLQSRGVAQVTMNIADHKETSLRVVYETIQRLVQKEGAQILESELVGMIPEEAVFEQMTTLLKLKNFSERQILRVHSHFA